MNRPFAKSFACLLTALLLFTLVLSLVPASYVDLTGRDGTSAPAVEVYIRLINMYGNLILSISDESMRTLGFEPGDVVTVSIGDHSLSMPIGTAYSNVNVNEPICCYRENVVILGMNSGSIHPALTFLPVPGSISFESA